MRPVFTIDSKQFIHDLKLFAAASGKTLKVVIKDEARLLVEALIKMTPPFNINHPVDGSYGEQLRIGKAVIKAQAKNRFPTIASFPILDKKLRKQVKYLQSMGLNGALESLLKKNGYFIAGVRRDISEAIYDSQRNGQGRIPIRDNKPPFLMQESGPINEMIKLKQSHLGKAKGGWVKAADALQVKGIPQWIRRHAAYGHYKIVEETEMGITYEVGNFVPFIQAKGSRLKIVREALNFRERRVKNRLEREIKYMK